MDMKVDSKRIRAERERRAWSQEHLATVSGLGLRTIQRIEKTGAASFESARALGVRVRGRRRELANRARGPARDAERREPCIPPSTRRAAPSRFRFRAKPMLGAAAALTAAGALFVATKGFADVVMLDVGVSMNDSRVEESQVVTEANDNVAFRAIDDQVRMVIVPTIETNGIMLSTEIYVLEGGELRARVVAEAAHDERPGSRDPAHDQGRHAAAVHDHAAPEPAEPAAGPERAVSAAAAARPARGASRTSPVRSGAPRLPSP